MTRLFDIESGFDRDGDLNRDEIRWLIRVAREASALCADSCLCSQTAGDVARLKLALRCDCGLCLECDRREKYVHEGRELMREYRIAKDGE